MSGSKDRKPSVNLKLLDSEVRVVNVGLVQFAGDLRDQGVKVVHVDWAPPAGGDVKLARLLSKLED